MRVAERNQLAATQRLRQFNRLFLQARADSPPAELRQHEKVLYLPLQHLLAIDPHRRQIVFRTDRNHDQPKHPQDRPPRMRDKHPRVALIVTIDELRKPATVSIKELYNLRPPGITLVKLAYFVLHDLNCSSVVPENTKHPLYNSPTNDCITAPAGGFG